MILAINIYFAFRLPRELSLLSCCFSHQGVAFGRFLTPQFLIINLIIFYIFRRVVILLHLRNRKPAPCFYRVIETRVEVWENEKCCGNTSCRSTAFSSSPKLSRVFLLLDRNREYIFAISIRKRRDEKKENNLLTLIIKV